MELKVERTYKKDGYTIGHLYVNGVLLSNTLEDKDRGLLQSMPTDEIRAKKVYGQTAIPVGRYRVTMTYSSKFANKSWAKPHNGKVPEVLDVPGFAGVRIHPGTTAEDTLGCILVGKNTAKGMITSSQITYANLVDSYIMPAISRKESVYLNIK